MGAWLAPVSRVLTHASASLRRLDREAGITPSLTWNNTNSTTHRSAHFDQSTCALALAFIMRAPFSLHASCSLGMLGGMCVHTDMLSPSELTTTRARPTVGSGSLSDGPSLQDTSSQRNPFLCSPCSTRWRSVRPGGGR